jgi:hypothetical protein
LEEKSSRRCQGCDVKGKVREMEEMIVRERGESGKKTEDQRRILMEATHH